MELSPEEREKEKEYKRFYGQLKPYFSFYQAVPQRAGKRDK